MPLPITYADALREEMVDRAVEAIQVSIRGWGLPVNLEEAIAILIDYMRRGAKEQQNITLNAEKGDYVSHLAIDRFFHDLILNHQMPTVPIVAYMTDPRRHPRRPRGRAWWENMRRDLAIALIVDRLCQRYNIDPRRSDGSKRKTPCGASIMAAAFQRCGHEISEKRVANILSSRTEWGGTFLSLLDYTRLQGGMSS